MRKMSKITVVSLFLLMLMGPLSGCTGSTSAPAASPEVSSSSAPAKVDFPAGKPINMIIPWAPGGGSDVGARILQKYLEKELGTTINVLNKPGAGGWVGWEETLAAKPDGYTIAMINTPSLYPGYLDPANKRTKNLESFQLLGNHVTDYCVIAIKKDETRFTNINELIEYAKKNELTACTAGVGTDDHILLETINSKMGTKLTQVAGNGWKDGYAALLGGHIDVGIANVGEVATVHDKDIKVVAIFSKERSKFLKDVPTWEEAGLPQIYLSSQRGFAMPKGAPGEVVDKLAAAFEKAIKDTEQIQKMADMGLDVDYIAPDEYYKNLKELEGTIAGMAEVMGWKK